MSNRILLSACLLGDTRLAARGGVSRWPVWRARPVRTRLSSVVWTASSPHKSESLQPPANPRLFRVAHWQHPNPVMHAAAEVQKSRKPVNSCIAGSRVERFVNHMPCAPSDAPKRSKLVPAIAASSADTTSAHPGRPRRCRAPAGSGAAGCPGTRARFAPPQPSR